jgi:predicted lipid-binding transport protein (Tim44 family)
MQIFDILIMAVIAFLVFRFIAARRRKQQSHMAPAGAPMQREVFEQKPAGMGSIFGGSAAPVAARPVINAPAWFNENNFIEAARNHFQSLQQHWDANEMDKIFDQGEAFSESWNMERPQGENQPWLVAGIRQNG